MNVIPYIEDSVDVVVIGAGHAGCEAGLAAARLGHSTIVLSISLDAVADMPCNPNIGGTGKGHLVREIDALGGEMALIIDQTSIQSRMLNTSKGPAVHSLRVQADKRLYHTKMKQVLENQDNLRLIEGEAVAIVMENGLVTGVRTATGAIYCAKTVIIATGTYLRGEILLGELQYSSGPHGMKPSMELSDSLREMDLTLRRFKTGTPARVNRRSVDFTHMEIQEGDEDPIPFSFMNVGKVLNRPNERCYLVYTNLETKAIINANLSRSPMYAGEVRGVGPRYCPSIEDKIVRFSDKDGHQVFLEPEGMDTNELYVQGFSTTLPYEVQQRMYRTIPGMEKVEIMRPAYGIEYDCIDPTELTRSLESMKAANLFFAGQINGSSGYEEAAAQGLMAGINASLKIKGEKPFVLDRSDAYIGVLIDDLVTKGTNEPYRMMTSRAEYRLTLRQDNADLRLTEKGYHIGLVTEERYGLMLEKKRALDDELSRLKNIVITPTDEYNNRLQSLGTADIRTAFTLYDLMKRPELSYESLGAFDPDRPILDRQVVMQVETHIKYEGYIAKQLQQISQFKKMENKSLASIADYSEVKGLKSEAVMKLNRIKPDSLGQASRISGVSPADINVILIHLETEKRKES